MEILLTLYLFGFAVSLWRSAIAFIGFRRMKRNLDIDMFGLRPDLIRYFILKIIFWPYYFVTEKSPLERISETFFKYYGDKGYRYLGTRGLKNCLNDILHGKNRYKNYTIRHFTWELAGPIYEHNQTNHRHAEIILGIAKDHCLLDMRLIAEPVKSKTISRYVLDTCERLSLKEVKKRLHAINPDEFKTMQWDV